MFSIILHSKHFAHFALSTPLYKANVGMSVLKCLPAHIARQCFTHCTIVQYLLKTLQLANCTPHTSVTCWVATIALCWYCYWYCTTLRWIFYICDRLSGFYCSDEVIQACDYAAAAAETKGMECPIVQSLWSPP